MNLFNVKSFSNKKFAELGELISQRSLLKILSINVMECKQITDEGMEIFSENLCSIYKPNLKFFTIQYTDSGMTGKSS